MRPTTDHQRRDMKTLTWALLNKIGMSTFADLYGRVKVSELSKYCSHAEERMIPIDVLTDAELIAGDPILLRFLAGIHGFDLVPAEGPEAECSINAADVLRVAKETGDVAAAYTAAIADGRLDMKDKQIVRREIIEAITALMDLLKRI